MKQTDKRGRQLIPLARFLFVLTVTFSAVAFYLFFLNRQTTLPSGWGMMGGMRDDLLSFVNSMIMFMVQPLITSLFGLLVITRRSTHPIGWLLVGLGLVNAVMGVTLEYTVYGYYTTEQPLASHAITAWFGNWTWTLLFTGLFSILAIFPDGRFVSPRWRWLLIGPLVLFTLSLMAASALETPLSSMYQVDNPFIKRSPTHLINLSDLVGVPALVISMLVVLASVGIRFRQRRGLERQQIKWLLAGVAVMAAMVLLGLTLAFSFDLKLGEQMVSWSLIWPLLGIGVALLRYRLYDIDFIIRRTLSYTLLTGLLILVYFGSVVSLQGITTTIGGQQSSLVVALSTMLIAILFNPLRHRLQRMIDQKFYRGKYDAAQALAAFAATARDEVALERLTSELLQVVQQTVQPAQLSLWLKSQPGSSLVASENEGETARRMTAGPQNNRPSS